MIQAICFDLDDTLYNSTELSKRARVAAISEMINEGLNLELEEGYKILKEIVLKRGSNYSKHFNDFLYHITGKTDYRILSAGIIAYHNTKFAYIRPFKDTIPTLIHLREVGLKLAIITNGRPEKQWEKILRLSLQHFFDYVFISELVGFEKPDSRIYEFALKEMGIEPENALMIDDKAKDLKGALELGMKSVLIGKSSQDVDFEIKKLSDIFEVLERLGVKV
ncbi:MAG: TIGR02253 family HAD-type hydrolase [Candidatus Methanofastidiosia archaeon]